MAFASLLWIQSAVGDSDPWIKSFPNASLTLPGAVHCLFYCFISFGVFYSGSKFYFVESLFSYKYDTIERNKLGCFCEIFVFIFVKGDTLVILHFGVRINLLPCYICQQKNIICTNGVIACINKTFELKSSNNGFFN